LTVPPPSDLTSPVSRSSSTLRSKENGPPRKVRRSPSIFPLSNLTNWSAADGPPVPLTRFPSCLSTKYIGDPAAPVHAPDTSAALRQMGRAHRSAVGVRRMGFPFDARSYAGRGGMVPWSRDQIPPPRHIQQNA